MNSMPLTEFQGDAAEVFAGSSPSLPLDKTSTRRAAPQVDVDWMRKRLAHLAERSRTAEEALTRTQEKLARTEEGYARTQDKLGRCESELGRCESELVRREKEIARLSQALSQASGDAASANARIESLTRSTSWRVTAPLRLFRRSLSLTARMSRNAFSSRSSGVTDDGPAGDEEPVLPTAETVVTETCDPPTGEAPESAFATETAAAEQPISADDLNLPTPQECVAAPAIVSLPIHWEAQIAALEGRLGFLQHRAKDEQTRLDWALGALEGIEGMVERFHSERDTAAYQSVFDEANPLVSVCIATLNRAEQLTERALASVLSQTHRNLQVVIVGDCCTDDTALRVARLRDDRITFVNLPERGPYPPPGIDRWRVAGANAMNKALSLCAGPFITHLDDDDSMASDRIERLVEAAQRERSDFVWHAFWFENADGTWQRVGTRELELGQVTTGSIFYHRWFCDLHWDVRAYRKGEPGDWQRIRRIKQLRPRSTFVDVPLLFHHAQNMQPDLVAYDGEHFLS